MGLVFMNIYKNVRNEQKDYIRWSVEIKKFNLKF